jgi:hypothetical protein
MEFDCAKNFCAEGKHCTLAQSNSICGALLRVCGAVKLHLIIFGVQSK